MSVYVDKEENSFGRMIMCHMVADTLDELHAMAERIGLRRAWFQASPPASCPHYDLSKSVRAKAIKAGAVEVNRQGICDVTRRLRGLPSILPRVFHAPMISSGTAMVGVNVRREGWVPLSGDTYYCLRWVLVFWGLSEPAEVSQAMWERMDGLQKHVFALRRQDEGGAH